MRTQDNDYDYHFDRDMEPCYMLAWYWLQDMAGAIETVLCWLVTLGVVSLILWVTFVDHKGRDSNGNVIKQCQWQTRCAAPWME